MEVVVKDGIVHKVFRTVRKPALRVNAVSAVGVLVWCLQVEYRLDAQLIEFFDKVVLLDEPCRWSLHRQNGVGDPTHNFGHHPLGPKACAFQ